jgi:hypothetical protein
MGGVRVIPVHGPLVGPGAWISVARELERRGHNAVLTSLLGVADAPPAAVAPPR